MRLRSVAIFGAGFAAGVVFIVVLLWGSGSLRTAPVSAAPQPPRTPAPVARPQPAPAPPIPPAQPPAPPPVTTPPSLPAPGPTPSADLLELGARQLLIPVRGVSSGELRDSFDEARGSGRHEAIDIPAPSGTPVVAVEEGNVKKLFHSKPGGLTVYQFDDSETYCYYYAHLDRYAPGLQEGTLLRKGDVLGYVGTSGDAPENTPHLHFAICKLGPEKKWWQGTPINPYPILTRAIR